jgi:phage tail protein X
MSDYDMSIHTNPDARAWAKLFMETYAKNPGIVEEATMIGWFANAMMAMHDHLLPHKAPVVLPDGSAFVSS